MTNLSSLKKLIITALYVALCVVLPIAFHVFPNAGNALCPLHIPVLLCGLTCGWVYGGICGALGPFLSSLFTGMPPMAIMPCMIAELVAYGTISGVMMKIIRSKRLYLDLYASLITAIVVGKIIAGIVTALFFSAENYSLAAWAISYFVISAPAICIQLLLIPNVIVALYKAKLLPARKTNLSKN